MQNLSSTQYFKVGKEKQVGVDEVLAKVYEALAEKGYNPQSDRGLYYVGRSYLYNQP